MRDLFVLLMLTLPAIATAQNAAAQSKPPPGANDGGKAILAIDNGGHSSWVFDVLFTRDGKQLISIDGDKTVQIWDAVTGERLKVFRLPRQARQPVTIFQAALAPDNNTLAIAGYEFSPTALAFPAKEKDVSYAYLLHLGTGQLMQLPGLKPNVRIKALSFSGDGDHLAVGIGQVAAEGDKVTERGSIQVWSGLKSAWKDPLAAPQELAIPKPDRAIEDVVFAAKGSQLAVSVMEVSTSRVYRWDLAKADGAKEIKLEGHVSQLALSSDGSRFAAYGVYKQQLEVRVWSADGKLLKSITMKDLPATKPVTTGQFLSNRFFFRDNHELFFVIGFSTRAGGPESQALLRCDLDKNDVKTIQRLPAMPIFHRWTLTPDGKRAAVLGGVNKRAISVINVEGEPKPLQLARDLEKPAFAWSKLGYQIAWTDTSKNKLVAALDLKTGALLPKVDPTAFTKPGEGFMASDRITMSGQSVGSDILRIGKPLFLAAPERNALLSMYVAGQDWVIWTAEGYYAASPGGEKLVGWHVNNGDDKLASFYPVERFRKELYRPDVIKLVLEKGSVKEALKAADAAAGIGKTRDVKIDDLLPPRAVLSVLQQDKAVVKLKVQAEAAAKDQPVTGLRLLMDGRPLADGSANERFGDGKVKAGAEWSVMLPPGKHQLTVLARCPDASSKSNSIDVEVADPARQNTLRVLAIGVNDYEDSTLKLDFAAKDAQDIAANFQKCCKGELFTEVHGQTLVNAAARKDAVLKELAELRKLAKPNDLVVIFFAGHGVKEKDKFYLLPVEVKTTDLARTAISGEELRKSLGEFPCQVLLMLDACQSSGSLKSFRPAVDDITRNLTDDDCGVAVMCAAMAHEKALEKSGNGLFTRAVVQALNRAEGVPFNRHNRLFYVNHLHTFVLDEVREQSGDRQHPFLNLPWVVESFPLAKFADR